MTNLLAALITKTTGSTLSTLVGGRIYTDEAPADATFPYVVLSIISTVPEYPANKTIENILLQFSLFSTSPGLAEIGALLTALRALYDDASLTITDSTLVYCIRESFGAFTLEAATPSGTTTIRQWTQDYSLATVS